MALSSVRNRASSSRTPRISAWISAISQIVKLAVRLRSARRRRAATAEKPYRPPRPRQPAKHLLRYS
jgi:hypothetical protein